MGKFIMNGIPYGGTNCRELTLQEYQSLSAEEQMNGTMYFVIDGQGENGNNYFYPMLYSTEEREVGTWIDGKPLYQKTIECGNISGRTASVPLGIANTEHIFLVPSASKFKSTSDIPFPYVHPDTGNLVGGFFDQSTSDVMFALRIGESMSGYVNDLIITVRYTKTTDTPGSAKYNTLGVPTVHYDDTEKIVGTWFGETLYEKTYRYTSQSTSNPEIIDNNIKSNSGNINVVKIDGIWSVGNIGWSDATIQAIGNAGRSYLGVQKIDVEVTPDGLAVYRDNPNWGVYLHTTIQYTKSTT